MFKLFKKDNCDVVKEIRELQRENEELNEELRSVEWDNCYMELDYEMSTGLCKWLSICHILYETMREGNINSSLITNRLIRGFCDSDTEVLNKIIELINMSIDKKIEPDKIRKQIKDNEELIKEKKEYLGIK